MTDHHTPSALPDGARLAFCRTCNARERIIHPSGRCAVCGQYPDADPAAATLTPAELAASDRILARLDHPVLELTADELLLEHGIELR